MMDENLQPTAPHAHPMLVGSLAVLAVIVVGFLSYYVWQTNTNTTSQTSEQNQTITPSQTAISTDTQIQAANNELDVADLNSIDQSLASNDTDSASF